MQSFRICLLIFFLFALTVQLELTQETSLKSLESLATQFAKQTKTTKFNTKTAQGFNMDCLKAISTKNDQVLGVFHSSIEQKTSGYNAIYFAKENNSVWNKVIRMSERGSQGYIYQIPDSSAFLVLYELENHQKGNTIAIRFYENTQKLEINNFLYEYQLNQYIDKKKIVNIGTPNVQSITVTKKQADPKFNQYKLNIKFHYCPDGSHDYPGYGSVNLLPLRDFVDAQKHWIGGCKEDYGDWSGSADTKVENAIRKIGIAGKIGQRDVFQLNEGGSVSKYYFYEANLNSAFDWRNWRIVLYSEKEDRAFCIPFEFNQVVDLANPHISQFSYNQSAKQYQFWISFFIPGQGITPGTGAQGGEFTAKATILV